MSATRLDGEPTRAGSFAVPSVVVDRFWSKVDQSGGPAACWPWIASLTRGGYGKFAVGRRLWRSSRLAWALTHGDPGELFVLHRCDNPPCCNPAHLFLGTNADNGADARAKGRTARGDRNGVRTHPERVARGVACPWASLSVEQVRVIRSLYANGAGSQRQLGRRFGISQTVVSTLLRGKTYRDV